MYHFYLNFALILECFLGGGSDIAVFFPPGKKWCMIKYLTKDPIIMKIDNHSLCFNGGIR